jgi:hypothetical protein
MLWRIQLKILQNVPQIRPGCNGCLNFHLNYTVRLPFLLRPDLHVYWLYLLVLDA